MKEESKKLLKSTRNTSLVLTIIPLIAAITSYITEGWWNSRANFVAAIAYVNFFFIFCAISRVLKLEQE